MTEIKRLLADDAMLGMDHQEILLRRFRVGAKIAGVFPEADHAAVGPTERRLAGRVIVRCQNVVDGPTGSPRRIDQLAVALGDCSHWADEASPAAAPAHCVAVRKAPMPAIGREV